MAVQLRSQWFLRFILPAFFSLTLCGLLVLSLQWAASSTDEVASLRQRDLVTLTIAKLQAGVAHDQESATVWDDAVKNTTNPDPGWIEANLGTWMHSYFGHDVALVLRPDLSVLYQFPAGFENGYSAANLKSAYLPLARKLHTRLSFGDTKGTDARVLSIGESDLRYVGFRPAIVSVKPIVSDTGDIEQIPGEQMLHVAVRFLDGDLPRLIGREYEFADLKFSATAPNSPSLAAAPLNTSDGKVLGFFTWEPFQPGRHVLRATMPTLLAALVALFAASSVAANAISRRSDRLALSRAQLRHQASHDTLTGLANRAHFSEQLELKLGLGSANDLRCVMFVDLDRFKAVNDTHGHPIGDKLISLAAARMRSLLPNGLIGRIGGDEFIVLLDNEDARSAEEKAGLLVKGLKTPYDIDGAHISVGASIGVAFARGRCSPDEVTRQADIALYHAKAAGRNTYAMFGAHMDELLRSRRILEIDLRHAIGSGGQLEVFYQPVFTADGGKLCSLEALARWKHPALGYVRPDQFIPLAEEIGLINEIGALVLEDACMMLAQSPEIHVAINASAFELSTLGYTDQVLSALCKWDVSPARLEIEMTETAAAGENGELEKTITRLREAGVRFAIDDFGTGYSSFSRVQKITVDRIKIDKSFIDEMHRADNRALVIAMIEMARAKGLKITAEGVETSEQLTALQSLGCDDLQGFLLSKPLPRSEVLALMPSCRGGSRQEADTA